MHKKKGLFYEKEQKSFYVSRVLIALTIIGVVSALTIPALIQRTNKQEYVTALQKTYSTLSQVTNQIIAENGSPKCDDGGWACSTKDIYDMFEKYLNNVKECGTADKSCMSQSNKLLNGAPGTVYHTRTGVAQLILADGAQIAFDDDVFKDCVSSSWFVDNIGSYGMCTTLEADINGIKQPNQAGRDIFVFVLKENGLYPAGCDLDKCTDTAGWGCACKVLREGAMNY